MGLGLNTVTEEKSIGFGLFFNMYYFPPERKNDSAAVIALRKHRDPTPSSQLLLSYNQHATQQSIQQTGS